MSEFAAAWTIMNFYTPCECGYAVKPEPPDELTKLKADVVRLRSLLISANSHIDHTKECRGRFGDRCTCYLDRFLAAKARALEETKP